MTSLPTCVAGIVAAVERGDQVELRRQRTAQGQRRDPGRGRLRWACQRLEHTGRDRDPDIDEAQLDALALTVEETCLGLRERLLAD